jgi:hypothetical protein
MFVLMVLISLHGNPGLSAVEFSTLEACQAARNLLLAKAEAGWVFQPHVIECVKK